MQPASRNWQPAPADRTSRGGSLRTPAMRTLVIVLIAVGMLLGAGEVAVIAVAKALHTTMGGAPLFAVWGPGSFIGGLLVARLGGGARTAAGLALLLGALTAGHLALIPADGSALRSGPCCSSLAPRSRRPKPPCTRWSTTPARTALSPRHSPGSPRRWRSAMPSGAAGAGIVADRAGPAAAFALAGAAGALAMLTCMLRSRTIGAPTSRGRNPAAPIAADSSVAAIAHTARPGDCADHATPAWSDSPVEADSLAAPRPSGRRPHPPRP